jgi:uncharacterized radical SAM protein YgiQ
MFIPATREELKQNRWESVDVILVTGDAYIDSPYIGVSVIGQVLMDAGYRVGIIAQPDIQSDRDITRLGEPELFWGVTAGSMDSLVSNLTASKKKRQQDDLTPGGENLYRPNRASIVYTGLIRRFFKQTVPIVLGGVEASLRRIVHYDHWSNGLRRSILFDAKADLLIYGMGEKAVLELAAALKQKREIHDVKGMCYISGQPRDGFLELPSWETVSSEKDRFTMMFDLFYRNNDAFNGQGLYQAHGKRYLVCNPPQSPLSPDELDRIHELPYERDIHPADKKKGEVRALETIRFSITTHRGCFGECRFCSIALHQGNRVVSRSQSSILREVENIKNHPAFNGIIRDVGGPTANMYGMECGKKVGSGRCLDKACLFPEPCSALNSDHGQLIRLLDRIRTTKGIKKVFVASGIRHDLVLADKKYGQPYLAQVLNHHTSGQLKIAPEHCSDDILSLMGKPSNQYLDDFKKLFDELNRETGKKQYLTYYFIAAHPGCSMRHMRELREFIRKKLHIKPEQVQIFTPSPSTYSTLMFYTGTNPFTGESIFVEREMGRMEKQKKSITGKAEG